MQIPTLSIVFMCVSALLSIGAPIALIVVFRKKFKIQAAPFVVGVASFIVFALILEAFVHQLALAPDAYGYNAITQSPVLFMLYGGFMAGIFEETGRFVSFKLLKKRFSGVKTGLAYGIGHGGIESVLLVGVSLISSVIAFISINAAGAEQLIASAGASGAQLEAQIAAAAAIPPAQFLAGGVERLFAIAIQISLSVFVYYAVDERRRWYLYPLAILMHAVVDFFPGLYQTGLLGEGGLGLILMEALVGLYAALLVFLAVRLHRLMKREEPKADETSQD